MSSHLYEEFEGIISMQTMAFTSAAVTLEGLVRGSLTEHLTLTQFALEQGSLSIVLVIHKVTCIKADVASGRLICDSWNIAAPYRIYCAEFILYMYLK